MLFALSHIGRIFGLYLGLVLLLPRIFMQPSLVFVDLLHLCFRVLSFSLHSLSFELELNPEDSQRSCTFWAADPKGTMSYRAEGGNFRPSVLPSPLREPLPSTDGQKFPHLFHRTLSPSGPLPCIDFSIEKRRPAMVSSTLCPAVHILGSQNMYSRAEGIADRYLSWPIF